MIIYKDKITGDELFSDIYPMKLVDDIIYEVTGEHKTEKMGVDCNTGSNPSAEGGDDFEDDGEGAVSGVDVVLANRLVETSYDSPGYKVHIKEYMKSIRNKLKDEDPERLEIFAAKTKTVVPAFLKKDRFKEFQFFTGESMDPEGHVALMEWREEGTVPVLMFFKDGVIAEKV